MLLHGVVLKDVCFETLVGFVYAFMLDVFAFWALVMVIIGC